MILTAKSTPSSTPVTVKPLVLRDKSWSLVSTEAAKLVCDFLDKVPASRVKDYSDYWSQITPNNDEEFRKRWLFSFLSVHCGWRANVKGYLELTKPAALATQNSLRDAITVSGVGLIKMRSTGIWKFKQDFEQDANWWRHNGSEVWSQYRDRLMHNCYGLAHAKTAFAIEMCYPLTCNITCLDTHMLQLYLQKEPPSNAKYRALEQHWVTACRERSIPPAIGRHIYWDTIQKREDCRYWTYLFEKEPLTFGAKK